MNDEKWAQRLLAKREAERTQTTQPVSSTTDVGAPQEAGLRPPHPRIRKRKRRLSPLLAPVLMMFLWERLQTWVSRIVDVSLTFLQALGRVLLWILAFPRRLRQWRDAMIRKVAGLIKRIILFFLKPLVRMSSVVWRRVKPIVKQWYDVVARVARSLLAFVAEAKQGYDHYLASSDRELDRISDALEAVREEVRYSLESVERRSGVQFSGSTAWIKARRSWRRRAERWGFVVIKPEVFRNLPDPEILFLLDQLHQRLTPFKQILMLEKTQATIQRNADWCRAEFARTRNDWPIYAPKATIDPEAWYTEAFEWLVTEIGRQNLAWNGWIVMPARQIPRAFLDRLLREVQGREEELFLDRVEYERMLYKLVNPYCDSEPEDILVFEEFQRRLYSGEPLWKTLFSGILSVEPWGIQTTSGAWMTSIRIHSLGTDVVTYTPKPKEGEEEKSYAKVMIRDLEWLKQQLTPVLMLDARRDQQIWMTTAVVGVPKARSFMETLKRHLRTIGAWEEKDREGHEVPVRKYADVISTFYDDLDKRPVTLAFQQSFGLMLKAGSYESLMALRDRVKQVLGFRDVFYQEGTAEHHHWETLRRMLPVIWKPEVDEDYSIPRRSLPVTMEELRTILKTPQIDLPQVGGIIGTLGQGPMVIGPGNYGILGTTEVGKSVLEESGVSMTYALAPGETEVFVVNIIGLKPGAEGGGWHKTLTKLFGGEEIFPSLFKTPAEMREYLESLVDTLVFLYNPNEDLDGEGVAWDMQFLKWVLARITMKRELLVVPSSIDVSAQLTQLTLPPFESLLVNQGQVQGPPPKRILRRIFALDQLEMWMRRPDDPRASFITKWIMGEARKNRMTVIWDAKSMEAARTVNPSVWSDLKHLTDKGWFLYWTPDPESVPENIPYPRTTAEESRRADLIVEMIKDIRRLGGMTRPEDTYGHFVFATGDFITRGRNIVPPPMLPSLERITRVAGEAPWGK